MEFAGSDNPITELVWSPQSGLSFRCANNSGSADKRPFLVWNVGSSNGEELPPAYESMKSDCNGGSGGVRTLSIARTEFAEHDMSRDKVAAATFVGPSRSFCAAKIGTSCGDCGDSKNNNIMEEVGTTRDVILEKENCSENGDEDLCETAGFAGLSRKDDAGLNTLSDGINNCKHDKTIDGPSPAQLIRKPHCDYSSNNVEEVDTRSEEKTDFRVAEAFVGTAEVDMNDANAPLPISALPLRREKGKEKALSDESAESCNNSFGLFSKGIYKRQREDDGRGLMVHESKRMKKQTTMDSSFMKWISNMVKGLPERSATVKEESSSLALSKAHHYGGVSNGGFQTIFQSLNCRNMNISNNGVRNNNDSTDESKQFNEIIENLPDGKNDNPCKQIVVVSDKDAGNPTTNVVQESRPWIFSAGIICSPYSRVENDASGNLACTRAKDRLSPSDSLGKQVNSTEEKMSPEKVIPLKSLWITRFSTSTPGIEKRDGCPSNRAKSNSKNLKYNKLLFNNVTTKDTVAPSGIFHAIRNLRLSRSDILRWMNSNDSLANLNGFFLRLRLGKMEEGIGATRYYVACITGDAREHNRSRSTKSIVVDVGGIKSSVESQYVSNHEFLEDEIKAWWCRTVGNGCKIPSLDELNLKVNDRKCLRF